MTLLTGREMVYDCFESRIFPLLNQQSIVLAEPEKSNSLEHSRDYCENNSPETKIYPKQMLQRLPLALAQVKAGNTSENSEMKSVK